MPRDAVDGAGICNKGDDGHAAATTAQPGMRLADFLDRAGPRAAGFPGDIRIVDVGSLQHSCSENPWRTIFQFELLVDFLDQAGSRDAVNPFERIQFNDDSFKFRNRIGVDVALEALRDCYRQKIEASLAKTAVFSSFAGIL